MGILCWSAFYWQPFIKTVAPGNYRKSHHTSDRNVHYIFWWHQKVIIRWTSDVIWNVSQWIVHRQAKLIRKKSYVLTSLCSVRSWSSLTWPKSSAVVLTSPAASRRSFNLTHGRLRSLLSLCRCGQLSSWSSVLLIRFKKHKLLRTDNHFLVSISSQTICCVFHQMIMFTQSKYIKVWSCCQVGGSLLIINIKSPFHKWRNFLVSHLSPMVRQHHLGNDNTTQGRTTRPFRITERWRGLWPRQEELVPEECLHQKQEGKLLKLYKRKICLLYRAIIYEVCGLRL